MKLIENITTYVDNLSIKRFYLYSGIFVGSVFLIHGFIMFNHYNTKQTLENQIEETNELREKEIKNILTSAYQVRKQKETFNALLAQDPDFKIGSFMQDLLTDFGLTAETKSITRTEREENYLEEIMTLQLVDLNTQQAVELIDKIETAPRINIKNLEITKSRKKPNTIEVTLTIAALQQK